MVKTKIKPVPCTCGKMPVIVKHRGRPRWLCGCVNTKECDCIVCGSGPTADAAVEAWNKEMGQK